MLVTETRQSPDKLLDRLCLDTLGASAMVVSQVDGKNCYLFRKRSKHEGTLDFLALSM